MSHKQRLLFAVMLAAIVAFFALGWQRYLSFSELSAQRAAFAEQFARAPWLTASAFAAIYILVTALSLPGAAPLTLVGGALFGLGWGTVIVSFASTIGATLAFLASRFLFREHVMKHFGERLRVFNEGVEKDGGYYLFTLRLVPLFPFFLINLLMGLTPMNTRTYYTVSQLGMLPGTLVYVNAGTQLGQVQSLQGIVSPGLLLSFALLGIFPYIARWAMEWLRTRRLYKQFPKPAAFDTNLIVIGAGSAGLVSAFIAAALKARVTLIEKHKMGGDCLNYGCVPSKALIRSARLAHQLTQAAGLGMSKVSGQVDFRAVMERVQQVIRKIEPHDSVARYTDLGVDCVAGDARLLSPWSVEVNGKPLTARSIIIAAGSAPAIPDLPGLSDLPYLTSDSLWALRDLPPALSILGGGPIGCEIAQAFAHLGTRVTIIQRQNRLLPREDDEVSTLLRTHLESDGVRVLTGCVAQRVDRQGNKHSLYCQQDGKPIEISGDALLVAVGRKARTGGYGLEQLGIGLNADGTIATNAYLQTTYPNIFACGDVAGPYQFTHVAAHQAWYAAVNALLGQFRKFRADYRVIPTCTFTQPEIARVGHNERSARAANIGYEITRYDLDDLDRAITDEAAYGFVKVLTAPGNDRILGVTIAGEHAGDMLPEFVLAMRHGLGLNKILGTVHAYPTFAEANKYTAGAWKKAHAPQRILAWLARYHAWRRNA